MAEGNDPVTILIVEDEEPIRRLLTRLLETADYCVVGAGSGNDALAWCDENGAPDLVISDVLMPLMSGFQLYEELTARFENVSVLFMTGHAGDNLEDGAESVPVLAKPFTRSQLLVAVEDALG